VELQTLV
jgi:hypothetical protein